MSADRAFAGPYGEHTRHIAIVPAAILRKWDRLAVQQLCHAVVLMDESIHWLEGAQQLADHYQALSAELADQLHARGELPTFSSGLLIDGTAVMVQS